MTTNDAGAGEMLDPVEFWSRLRHNVVYFFIGRHFGLLPYHFPGVLIVALWLARPRSWQAWQVAILLTVAATAAGLLVYTPFSWSGGGGPLGNRYFLSVYPALFFLLPAALPAWSVAVAWAGGLACTAFALTHPFAVAYRPGLASQQGLPRVLPVELTMVTDLPLMLEANRGRIPYGTPPDDILLYYLDDRAWLPDAEQGIWVTGTDARADIILRSDRRPVRYLLTLRSLTATRVHLSLAGDDRTAEVRPGVRTTVVFSPTDTVFSKRSYATVLSVRSEQGTEPRLVEPGSTDARNLGVQVHIKPILAE